MAISFVGQASNSATNGGDVTLTFPGGVQQNDLVIVAYSVGDNDSAIFNMAMITAGYTEVVDIGATTDTQDVELGVFWKVMGATPDTSAQVDGLGGSDASVAAVCQIFRGVDTTTPMDVAPTSTGSINTMHPNPPSINHNNPSGVWTVIVGASGHTLGGAGTYTYPLGYINNNVEQGADDTGGDTTIGMSYRPSPGDPEDPGQMSHSGSDNVAFSWVAATLALRPAASGSETLTADSGSFSITGTAATLRNKLTASNGSVALTGTNAIFGGKLTAASGSIVLTGTNAAFKSLLTSGVGSLVITGTDASFTQGRTLIADAGSFNINGTAASFANKFVVGTGSLVITGTDVAFREGIKFLADSGVFVITGTSAVFRHKLVANAGSIVITGTDVVFDSGGRLTADTGSFLITGTPVVFGNKLTSASGSVSITGAAALFDHTFNVANGVVLITGTDVTFIGGGGELEIRRNHSAAAGLHIRRNMRRGR